MQNIFEQLPNPSFYPCEEISEDPQLVENLMPYQHSPYSSAVSLRLHIPLHGATRLVIKAGEIINLKTGQCINLVHPIAAFIIPFESLADQGLSIANSPHLISPDFHDEIKVRVINNGKNDIVLSPFECFASIVSCLCVPIRGGFQEGDADVV